MGGKLQLILGGADGESPLHHWDGLGAEWVDRHAFDAYWGKALGSVPGAATLNVTRYPGGSSLLLPDARRVSTWRHPDGTPFEAALEIVERRPVERIRLDDWCRGKAVQPDFISLNVQGCETDILVGTGNLLAHVLGLQLEVAFKPYYIDQPDFGTMFIWLRDQGFDFFDLYMPNHIGRMRSLVQGPSGTGQLFEAHTLWLRREELGWNPQTLAKQAVIAELYGQTEKAHELAAIGGLL